MITLVLHNLIHCTDNAHTAGVHSVDAFSVVTAMGMLVEGPIFLGRSICSASNIYGTLT